MNDYWDISSESVLKTPYPHRSIMSPIAMQMVLDAGRCRETGRARDLCDCAYCVQDRAVADIDPRGESSFCSDTGLPAVFCSCGICNPAYEEREPPQTLQTFPAATPVPEMCSESYYGIPCTEPTCPRKHKLPRRKT